MLNKSLISRIVAILVVICFFLSFATVSYFGFGTSVSGFTLAFSFAAFGAVIYLIALLTAVAAAVFGWLPNVIRFMEADKFCMILEIATAVLIILGGIINSITGVGWWLAVILCALNVAWYFLGDKVMGSFKKSAPRAAYQPRPQAAAQQKASFCTACGAKINNDAKFCPSCGAPRK